MLPNSGVINSFPNVTSCIRMTTMVGKHIYMTCIRMTRIVRLYHPAPLPACLAYTCSSVNVSAAILTLIEKNILRGLQSRAFPGCHPSKHKDWCPRGSQGYGLCYHCQRLRIKNCPYTSTASNLEIYRSSTDYPVVDALKIPGL